MKAEIRLLGQASAVCGEGDLVAPTAWRTAKTFDLMRVLALTPGCPVPIPTLLDSFWPSSDPAHGGTSLRTAASQIRKVLGSESVVRVGHSLMLDASVDVAHFRDVACRADLARSAGDDEQVVVLVDEAEALYGGDLEVSGTECSLLHEARRDLALLRHYLLLEAAEAAGRCGNWRRSLDFARRAAAIERSDRSTRAMMRAWFGLGEAGKPVEEFERLRLHLAEDYGVDPAPQTRALYLEMVGSCAEWPPRETTVGRQREIRQVVSASLRWLMEATGSSGVVWLVGRNGSGRDAIACEAAKTILGLADETSGADLSLQVMPDQGTLTKGSAEMLRRRAAATGRILLVPVSEESASVLACGDAIVEVPPLEYPDFQRLMSLILHGRPEKGLVDELYAESRGLPGLACRVARRRVAEGDFTWGPGGVDRAHRSPRRSSLVTALAALPFALAGLVSGERIGEPSVRGSSVVDEQQKHSAGGTAQTGSPAGRVRPSTVTT